LSNLTHDRKPPTSNKELKLVRTEIFNRQYPRMRPLWEYYTGKKLLNPVTRKTSNSRSKQFGACCFQKVTVTPSTL